MDYYLQGGFWLILGTVSVGIGGLFLTLGWNVWPKQPEKTKWYRHKGVGFVIRGSLLVALGSVLVTHGWNDISFGEQRNNLIRAVTQEWFLNNSFLVNPPMKGKIYDEREDGEFVWYIFPTLRNIALNTALSSGFWDYGNQTDRKFLNTISAYEKSIDLANRKFRSYDNALLKIRDPNERVVQTKRLRRATYENNWFNSLDNTQNQVGKLIWSDYRWAIRTQLPEAYKLLLQKIQEKSAVSES